MTIKHLDDAYFDALGEPKPGGAFNVVDDYRFDMAIRHLLSGSVLDVGVYFGDFLKRARDQSREISGTEINQKRVDLANKLLGENVVRLDFRNGRLTSFDDRTFDNVVCTEVLEHVPDQQNAVSELCRVAKRTVIITVPFREKIQTVCCVHCAGYTPYSGHLHAYGMNTFQALVPPGWHVAKQKSFGKRLTKHLVRLLRLDRTHSIPFVRALDFLLPGQGSWLLVVLERKELNDQDSN